MNSLADFIEDFRILEDVGNIVSELEPNVI